MDHLPRPVYLHALEDERAGYVAQLARRPELKSRVEAVDAEIKRVKSEKAGKAEG